MASLTGYEDLDLALDLLVAHASINADLRKELLNNPEAACMKNGINLPIGTKLVFSSQESPVIVKEIPINTSGSITTEKTGSAEKQLISSGLNEQTTETNTTEAVEAETTEAAVTETTVAAVTEAVVVLV